MRTNNIVHVLMSDYRCDSRVRNETNALVEQDYNLTVLCMGGRDLADKERKDGVFIDRGYFHKIRVVSLFLNFFIIQYKLIKYKPILIHAHEYSGLLTTFLVSKILRVPLIYDSHELWAYAEHRIKNRIVLAFLSRLEEVIANWCNAVITVSDSIAEDLKKRFQHENVITIRNIPSYIRKEQHSENFLRKHLGISDDKPIFIYQGVISVRRGVNLIIDALLTIESPEFYCVFLGDGDYLAEAKQKVLNENLSDFVFFLGAVAQDELDKYASGADVGVHPIVNSCLNHYFCLPNKVFEYIHLGLALLVSDQLELSKLVVKVGNGICFEDNNSQDLAQKMVELSSSHEDIKNFKQKSRFVQEELSWSRESVKLLELYSNLLK